MKARQGDRIVILAAKVDEHLREGEIVAVDHPDGSPPYRVRWTDTGQTTLLFPGPDARIDHQD